MRGGAITKRARSKSKKSRFTTLRRYPVGFEPRQRMTLRNRMGYNEIPKARKLFTTAEAGPIGLSEKEVKMALTALRNLKRQEKKEKRKSRKRMEKEALAALAEIEEEEFEKSALAALANVEEEEELADMFGKKTAVK